jgi:hypothetical protein
LFYVSVLMNLKFKEYLLENTQSVACEEVEIIQSLWSGYGKISRYELTGSLHRTVVVKYISPCSSGEHPKGWDTDNSHNRKVKSYEVETHWYEQWNDRCPTQARVPHFIGSFSLGADQWIILEDLDANFSVRKQKLDIPEVKNCLRWLANFHGTFLGCNPTGLWQEGTYWHLGTRPDEYDKMEHPTLKAKAHAIDALLNQCSYQTIVHGDAKVANFCFSENGEEIAVVDFQYVGGGCGMRDVAYLLGSCLSSDACEVHDGELLDYYFIELAKTCALSASTFCELEEEWRRMYPVACADFMRFLFGWMPTHQKLNAYNLKMVEKVLDSI